ncbi:chorismate synthase [Clostridium sp. NSJ-49]|jgi:chorismate synthase|uniref:chorismate synthase n=1 Tax=Clostridium TaxID=1485 RepID=UPI00164CBBC3|nr:MULTISPECIES: chorismate synthase [unclassified Clostridium]MBC5626340.1 chorismate synthase [Clostridium sp. NSJ-49]MCD2501324.1 chorismate synthase [Clostridium sp. NSJ-145]
MSGMWGSKIKISIFGESHGNAIGINIDGLPSGLELNLEDIAYEMRRRAPGKSPLSTARSEEDIPEILSGYFNGKTTGTPLCAIIRNTNTRSKDYSLLKDVMRPGHADYSGNIRYNGFNDYRGGGHFSGRITAPLVFAGAICKQILKEKGIVVAAHVKSIKDIKDKSFLDSDIDLNSVEALKTFELPLIDKSIEENMRKEILEAKEDMDSVGGTIECGVFGINPGVGDPFFDSVESTLAHLLFSVPAVKGVEFGRGFELTNMRGSQANDEIYYEDGKVKTRTNNNGGILGGITNGMPIIFTTAIKPTSSIGKEQKTVNINTKENTILKVEGRHDPCIVQRAIPVIEAVTAIGILELLS